MTEYEWEVDPGWMCADCGIHTGLEGQYYMVHDYIWEIHGVDEGMLCIACLETRVGRTLGPADFTNAPVNRGAVIPLCAALQRRIGLIA